MNLRNRLLGALLTGTILAAGCGPTDEIEVVLSDDPWESVSEVIELGEETIDNCLGDETLNYLEGATITRTYRQELTRAVGASLGVEKVVVAEVEASLSVTLGRERTVAIPSERHPVPPRDSRRFRRKIVQDYRLNTVSLDGSEEEVKVLWAERLVAERIPGTGNLCPPISIPTGLVGKRPAEVKSLLNDVGIEAVPFEYVNAWCDSVPGRVSAVRFVRPAYERLLDTPLLVEPVEGDRPELRVGDVVEMIVDVEPDFEDSIPICLVGYTDEILELPVSAQAAGLNADLD